MLSPFVYWAQSEANLFLKIDLRNVKKPNLDFEERRIQFEGNGLGAKGCHNYGFSLDLYSTIKPEDCTVNVLESKVVIVINKAEKAWWPRISSQPQKPAWLKIDFDRWQSEDDINDEEETRDVREDYPDLYQKLQKEEMGYRKEDLKKVYLIVYNFFMYVGYLYICCVLGIRFLKNGTESFSGTYEAVGSVLCFLQMLQILEVLHPLFGYTRGSAFTASMQVFGRGLVLFPLIDGEERMQTKPVVFYLFMVWSIVEVIRYPYYILQLYKKENAFLTWLRYTIWIPLYPLGFICEGIIILRSILYFEETGKFTVALPNVWNFTFHFPTLLRIYMLLFSVPGIYTMMSYMYKARVQKLGPKKWEKTK